MALISLNVILQFSNWLFSICLSIIVSTNEFIFSESGFSKLLVAASTESHIITNAVSLLKGLGPLYL